MREYPDFNIDVDSITKEQIKILRAICEEGQNHLKYYHDTMSVFKNPQNRIKTFDTCYYERVMPSVIDIIRNYEEKYPESKLD